MNYLHSIILGIVQGLTEFLPVSSSAHLVLVPQLFGWQFPPEQIFPFDVLVQLGTLLAVIIYFWKDLLRIVRAWVLGLVRRQPFADPDARLGWYLILATIPAGLGGLLIKDYVEAAFHSPAITAAFLILTAALLLVAEFVGRRTRPLEAMNWKDALIIGVFQLLSVFPGISRSGSTIAGGMLRNLQRPDAGRFSFLMSIPIMAAAGLLSIGDLADVPNLSTFLPVVLVGFVVAGIIGFLSIHWLLRFLARRPLTIFAAYCAVFGLLNLIVYYV